MYDTILYPTDGSAGANAALTHAHELASQYDATVHVLHVADSSYIGFETGSGPESTRSGMMGGESDESLSGMLGGDPNGDRSGMLGGDPGELRTEHRERAETLLADVTDRFTGVETESVLRVGTPHQIITAYATHHDIDLIVMGTHGRTGVDRYLLGSVTEKVVRLSDVPVITVRETQTVSASESSPEQ